MVRPVSRHNIYLGFYPHENYQFTIKTAMLYFIFGSCMKAIQNGILHTYILTQKLTTQLINLAIKDKCILVTESFDQKHILGEFFQP